MQLILADTSGLVTARVGQVCDRESVETGGDGSNPKNLWPETHAGQLRFFHEGPGRELAAYADLFGGGSEAVMKLVTSRPRVQIQRRNKEDRWRQVGLSSVNAGTVRKLRVWSSNHSLPLRGESWKCGKRRRWISDALSVARIAEVLRKGVRRHASFVPDLKSQQRLRYFRLAPHRSRSALVPPLL
jgi:hypothetical protein